MKAILEFELPDDTIEHHQAVRANEVFSLLFDLDNECRSWLKHGHKFESADDAIEKIRDLLNEDNLLEVCW